jgi:predicted Zn-dependent protease
MKEELKTSYAEAVKLKDTGELEAARGLLLELSIKDPRSAAIALMLGDVCGKMSRFDEAIAALRRAVDLAPKSEGVSLNLFHYLWDLGKKNEALEEVKRFMSVGDSKDYREIVKEINEKCK